MTDAFEYTLVRMIEGSRFVLMLRLCAFRTMR